MIELATGRVISNCYSQTLSRLIYQTSTTQLRRRCGPNLRTFSATAQRGENVVPTAQSLPPAALDLPPPDPLSSTLPDLKSQYKLWGPDTTTNAARERYLMRKGTPPIGSRRRRAAIRSSQNIPFEQLPYQCFQEARKVLVADREKKLADIRVTVAEIKRLEQVDPSHFRSGERWKQRKILSLRQHLERLKILADINDPMVKRRFEDGLGDMSKPIYRYLAQRKWHAMEAKIINQRISQYHIVPDLLDKCEPTYDVRLFFRTLRCHPGDIVGSRVSEYPPRLRMQCFDAGARLLTIVVMDTDMPLPEEDTFGHRCHLLATNIPWDPTQNSLPFAKIAERGGEIALPWLPPFAQKGASYHRLSIVVLQHPQGRRVDVADFLAHKQGDRERFSLRSFMAFNKLKTVGFNIFRSEWDEGTADVMARHGIPGANIEFQPQKFPSLKPPRKGRGWEAKRRKPKFRNLWKYSKRIAF